MKKKLYHKKITSRLNIKKDIFQKYKEQNQKHCTQLSRQHTHNALATQKIVDVYLEDVKTEETFSSQDQKLVETTNL